MGTEILIPAGGEASASPLSLLIGEEVVQGGEQFREDFRRDVMRLEATILARNDKMAPEDCPFRHIFAPGSYARELTIPKGTLVIGKIHRQAHLNIVSAGRIRVMTENGVVEISAPHIFVSEPGIKRVGYAVEETVWTTVHVTEETDVEKIEAHAIAPSYEELSAPALEKDTVI
jgi:hypothetical protein